MKTNFYNKILKIISPKNILIGVILFLSIFSFFLKPDFVSAWAGSGTVGDPYQITTEAELDSMRSYPNNHFKLMNNISMQNAWVPIDDFKATFDGNGKTITGITVTAGYSMNGFFGYLSNSPSMVVKNLGLIGVDLNAGDAYYAGAFIGYNNGGTVQNCYSTGSITTLNGDYYGGGIVGYFQGGTIMDSYSSVSVNGSPAGGIAAGGSGGVYRTYSTGEMTGNGPMGISGSGSTASFYDTNTTGSVIGGSGIGKTTAEMKTLSTYSNAGWSIATPANWTTQTWVIVEGSSYPKLSWQYKNITSWAELNDIRNGLTNNYILRNNLSSGTTGYSTYAGSSANSGAGWLPIPYGFTGNFEGGGYTISDLYINRPTASSGLFSSLGYSQHTISNLGLTNVNITGGSYTGALVGNTGGSDITIDNVYSTGTINSGSAYTNTGGLVGSSNGTIKNSYSTVMVSGGSNVGGLVGSSMTNISYSHATGNVSGTGNYVGGLIGFNNSGLVTNSYARGNVVSTGGTFIGGLIGSLQGGSLSKAYASGNVQGVDYVGGLLGYGQANFSDTYATGNATASTTYGMAGGLAGKQGYYQFSNSYSTGVPFSPYAAYAGGLLGTIQAASANNSFWDTQTSTKATSAGGTGQTTSAMKTMSTFSGSSWSIAGVDSWTSQIWRMNDGANYPKIGTLSYVIGASAGAGGSISPAGNWVVEAKGSQTYTITPSGGYNISNVLVDGVSQGAISSYTFSNVLANHTISASFVASTCAGTPWGTVDSGYSNTAYATASPSGACTSETRTCNNGTMSGSYTATSCTAGCASTPWGAVTSGYSNTAYASSAPAGACSAETRTCTAGSLSGSYTATSCTAGCASTPWGAVTSGYSNTAWAASTADVCSSQTRTCSAGSLSGSYTATGCTVNSYTYTFDGNGATGAPSPTSVYQTYGTGISAPTSPTRTGYVFNGWSPAIPGTMPSGGGTSYAQWIDNTGPSAPGIMTTSWTADHYVNTSFTASTTGAFDNGSGIRGYRLCRSQDNSSGCYSWTANGEHAGLSEVVSGTDLPSVGTYRYYYWYAYDNAGNQSANSTAEYVRMDGAGPSGSISFPTSGGSYNRSTWGTISGTASDPAGLNYTELLVCTVSSGSWQYWNGSGWASGCSWGQGISKSGTSWSDSSLGVGSMTVGYTYSLYTRTFDVFGNITYVTNPWNFTYVNTGPPISTSSSPGNGATVNGNGGNITFTTNAVSDTDGQTVQYYFRIATGSDGETGAVCNSGWQTSTSYACNPGAGTFYWHVYTYDGVTQTNPNYVWSFYNNYLPTGVSVSPASGSYVAGAQTFTSVHRDPNGATDISYVHLLFNSSGVDGNNSAFYGYYVRGSNSCYIYGSDTNYAWNGVPYAQPNVTLSSCSSSASGTDLTVTWNLNFTNWNESGMNEYLYVVDNSSQASGWTGSYGAINVNTYATYTFDGNGATGAPSPTSVYQNYGTAIAAPSSPTRTGYTFAGWSPAIPATMPVSGGTSTAQWNVNSYTISFDSAGGSAVGAITQAYGSAVGAPASPTRTGYTFAGWSPGVPATMPAVSQTLTATWTTNSYGITWNANTGGSSSGAATCTYGASVTPTCSPSTGYSTATCAAFTCSTSNSFTPTFTPNSYGVTWNSATGGTSSGVATCTYNTTVTPTCTPSTGYSTASCAAFTCSTSNSFTPSFSANSYTISFDSAGGTAVNAITQAYGTATYAPLADPVKTGYTFAGWSPAVPATMGLSQTLTATWSIIPYTLSYSAGTGGTLSGTASQTVNYGGSGTAVTAVPSTGYSFTGWTERLIFTNGTPTFTPPAGVSSVEALVVAGGGGGGMDMGGGGGGGGVLYNPSYSVTPLSPYTVTVGYGGYGAPAGSTFGQPGGHQFTISAASGGNSSFGSMTALGGGFGASSYYGYLPNYGTGGGGNGVVGSGGGASAYTHGGSRAAAVGTPGQGNNGGSSGYLGANDFYGGGGGGAGEVGASGPNRPNGGAGILYSSISPYYFGGGGGGATHPPSSGNGGIGGTGGGGGGASWEGSGGTGGTGGINDGVAGGTGPYTPGGNGGTNTGGGGGGGTHYNSNNKGGNGGSGVVIFKYTVASAASRTETSVNANKILVANFSPNSYTITFDSAGGSAVTAITQAYATAVSAPAAPTKTGYTFAGWSPAVPATMGLSQTLTATWTANSYSVTWNSATGGSSSGVATCTYATTVTPTCTPSAGYTTATCAAFTCSTSNSFTPTFSPNSYSITFDSAGGSAVTTITQNYGTAVTPPAAPTKTGYTFAGWSPALSATMPVGGQALTATWTINSFLVSTSLGAGGSISPTSASVNYNSTTSFTIIQSAGYTITSASGCGGTLSGNSFVTGAITTACTVSVSFTINSYTLSYSADANGTISGIASQSVNYGGNGTTVTAVPNTGYIFSRWSDDCSASSTGGSITTEANGNRIHIFTSGGTFTPGADCTPEVLVVAGGGAGGGGDVGAGGGAGGLIYNTSYSVSGATTVTVGAGGTGAANSVVDGGNGANSVFGSLTAIGGGGGAGWGSASGAVGGSGGGSVSTNPIAAGTAGQGNAGGNGLAGPDYPQGGGGGAGAPGQTAVIQRKAGDGGSGLYFPQFGSLGGSPAGWFAGGGGGGQEAGTSGALAITGTGGLGGGGNGGRQISRLVAQAGVTNTGGGGGGEDPDAGGAGGSGIVIVRYPVKAATRADTNVTSPKTGTAIFVPNTYGITWNSATGGTSSGPATCVYATSVTPTCTPSAGYTTATCAVFTCGTTNSFTPTFTPNSYTYTFAGNGATTEASPASVTQNYLTSIATPASPARTGYTFTGWSPVIPATMPVSGGTSTAQWSINSYNVTFDGNGATGGATATQSLVYNTATALTSNGFTKTGYSFSGWNTAANGSGTAYTNGANYTIGAGAVTIYAQWIINTYLVSTSANAGGTVTPASQTVNHGSTTTFTITPNANYISSASGCGGSLVSTTYTTGIITAACTITVTFTAIVVPTVITGPASSITMNSSTASGDITATGNAVSTKRGFVYDIVSRSMPGNVAPGSSLYLYSKEEIGSFNTGAYTASLTSLSAGTTYYMRAYAYNSAGYSYGDEVSFITLAYPVISQVGFRIFNNANTTDVGSALSSQNSTPTLSNSGDSFRLRLLLHVATTALPLDGDIFKLQYANKVGECDSIFAGEVYEDISMTTPVAFYENFYPNDKVSFSTNIGDPTHNLDIAVNQSYVESNPFSNSVAAVPAGQDAKWDFSLHDKSAADNLSYCIRIVKSNGSLLSSYPVIPEFTTAVYRSRGGGGGSIHLESVVSPSAPVTGGGRGNDHAGDGQGDYLSRCNDGVDNDSDGLIDASDLQCHAGGTLQGAYDPANDSETVAPAGSTGGGSGGSGGGGDLGYIFDKMIKSLLHFPLFSFNSFVGLNYNLVN